MCMIFEGGFVLYFDDMTEIGYVYYKMIFWLCCTLDQRVLD